MSFKGKSFSMYLIIYLKLSLFGSFSITHVVKWFSFRASKIFLFVLLDAVAVKTANLGLDNSDVSSIRLPYHFLNGT